MHSHQLRGWNVKILSSLANKQNSHGRKSCVWTEQLRVYSHLSRKRFSPAMLLLSQSVTGLSWSGTHWVQILSHEREMGRHPECTHCQSTYWHVSGNWEETGIAELRTELETLELWDSKCYPGFNERLITTSRTWSTFFMIKILRQEGCNYITYPNLLFNTRLSIWCVRVLNNTFKTDGL